VTLAPSFDHASSLGRELSDERRELCLTTRDQRATVSAYANRARSAFFGSDGKAMTSRAVVEQLSATHPHDCRFWCGRFVDTSDAVFRDVFDEMPKDWITPRTAEFAFRFLAHNRAMLGEFAHA